MLSGLKDLFSGNEEPTLDGLGSIFSLLGSQWVTPVAFSDFHGMNSQGKEDGVPSNREVGAFIQSKDRPIVLFLYPPGMDTQEPFFSLRALLRVLFPGEVSAVVLRSTVGDMEDELREYRGFVSDDGSFFLFVDDPLEKAWQEHSSPQGADDLRKELEQLLVHGEPGLSNAPSTKARSIQIEEPLVSVAPALLFPRFFALKETIIRSTALSFGMEPLDLAGFPLSGGVSGNGTADELWYRLVLTTGSANLGGFWVFTRPPQMEQTGFASLTASLAQACVPFIVSFQQKLGLFPVRSGTVSRVTEVPTALGLVFALRLTVAVGMLRFEGRVLVPLPLILAISAKLGFQTKDPIGAFFFSNRALFTRQRNTLLGDLTLTYRLEGQNGSSTVVKAVPFYEILSLCSPGDYRRLLQNFIVKKYRGDELAELLFYRQTVSSDGGPRRLIRPPQTFDISRLVSYLPKLLRESFVAAMKEGVSSPTADIFLKRNEELFESLMGEIRSNSIVLGRRLSQLIQACYTQFVYPRKRKRLDGMIAQDYPLASFRALPPRLYRAVVDLSDVKVLAASVLGHESSLDEIARWCSQGKMAALREEYGRLEENLQRGSLDPDGVCALRSKMAAKGKEAVARAKAEFNREIATVDIHEGGGKKNGFREKR